MMPDKLSLLIADDHALLRKGLVTLLVTEGGYEVVAECSDGASALDAIRHARPCLAILDISMPGLDGLAVLAQVQQEKLATRIVLLTGSMRDEQAAMAMKLGARGIVLKDQAADDLLSCLQAVGRGERWLAPEVREAAERGREILRKWEEATHALTAREQEVAVLAAEGLSTREVARRLQLTEGTIKVHLHNIYQKLAVSTRAGLAAYLFRNS